MLRNISIRVNKLTDIKLCTSKFCTYNEERQKRVKKEIEESKKSFKWRTAPGENPDEWHSKFKLFGNEEQTSDFITMMQQPIDLSPSAIKKWWINRKEHIERFMQQYVSERHEILGNDLAAAHFIVHRGGSIKFVHKQDWVKADKDGEYDLPNKYHGGYKVEAIRCDNMLLYYEGLENIRGLHNLKFWSFYNVKTFGDWCLDRVSGGQNPNLEVLDLSGTGITYRGLGALYRINTLKLLIIDDPNESKEMELTCALLETCLPKLKIRPSKDIH